MSAGRDKALTRLVTQLKAKKKNPSEAKILVEEITLLSIDQTSVDVINEYFDLFKKRVASFDEKALKAERDSSLTDAEENKRIRKFYNDYHLESLFDLDKITDETRLTEAFLFAVLGDLAESYLKEGSSLLKFISSPQGASVASACADAGMQYGLDALKLICMRVISETYSDNKGLTLIERNTTGTLKINQAFVDALAEKVAEINKKAEKNKEGLQIDVDETFENNFAKNVGLLHIISADPEATKQDWNRLQDSKSLIINNNYPIKREPQEIIDDYFTPAIADYIAGKAHQGGFANLTHAIYSSKLLIEKNLVIPGSNSEDVQLNNTSIYITQPDGSVFYVEKLDIPCFYNPAEKNPKHSPDKDIPIAKLVTISKISADEHGTITHTLIDHKVYVMDKVAGQEIFDLENDKHVVKAYDKTNEQVDEVINKMIADQVPGFVAGNIFQRAWNSIKNFANEHPYLTAIIAVTALAVIATIITVTTFGVGAAPAAAAFGLGLTGIGSTAAGAAVIGFFTATAAAVATGATVAATAVATAVTTAVIVGLPLIAYGAVTGLLNLGGWLWDKTKAALSKTEEPKPITVKGSTLGIKRVVHKKESPSSSRSAPTSTDSDSEEQTLSGPFITDRKLATSEKEEEEKEESGKPVPPISGKSARI